MKDKFAAYHPLINFTFFMGAFLCAMILMHPAFLICSFLGAVLYYLTIKGRSGIRFVGGILLLMVVLSAMNPLFNTLGEHVLFTYWNGRAYTLEALFYGMAMAAMMGSVLIWFASYNAVMTSDKFLYLFGALAPSATLVLTMVLRLVPSYKKKLEQMNGARKCLGISAGSSTKREQAEHGLTMVSALTSWALEGGVITADSMRARGYGCGKRTTFSLYRFEKRDRILLVVMVVLLGIVLFCSIQGAAFVTYTPKFAMYSVAKPAGIAGLLAYAAFLNIPTAVNIWEEIRWYSLKSKI